MAGSGTKFGGVKVFGSGARSDTHIVSTLLLDEINQNTEAAGRLSDLVSHKKLASQANNTRKPRP